MHIGIIMDGNGRWAARQNKKREFGHRAGAKNVDKIVQAARELGVKALSLFAFSTENWKREKREVDNLFSLLKRFIRDRREEAMKSNVKFCVMGDINPLPSDLKSDIESLVHDTRENTGLILNIAINYGGRDEIVRASNAAHGQEITTELLAQNLYTHDLPDLDLIVRTGGEVRLSNFMLWQAAYAELYFTDTLWPDFDKAAFTKAIEEFNGRKRNFGAVQG